MGVLMSQMSRREALGFGALLAAPALGLAAARAKPRAAITPDLILINGHVLTIDPALPAAEGFAVRDGRFVAIGSSADMRSLAAHHTEIIDAGGMTVTPGFIDAHCHPGEVEELYDVSADVRSIREIQDGLRARARQLPP